MLLYKTTVIIESIAFSTPKWQSTCLFVNQLFAAFCLLFINFYNFPLVHFNDFFEIKLASCILICPNTTHLHYWPKFCPLHFIKIMIELICTFAKLRLLRLDGQLHFYNHCLFIQKIYQYVFVFFIQLVFHPQNSDSPINFLNFIFIYFLHIFVKSNYLIFI